MEEFKKWLQEFVNKYPGRKYLIKDNGEPNWEFILEDSNANVNNAPFPALKYLVEQQFVYEDYYE
jgi:predicted phosphohydrolase|tara:strand:+ start:1271 stop:1465 length:195 start_codon:yes stop_codon:yes gene_type:complete